ncbi:hypothetical protein [Paracoccus sp. (in: a-proteobacteria)]|uniref:hypothetical protein n=1 Tax=Paracoccus sp. TaxID=267 RepID=UPI0028998F0E|nr:hypothetical protein [Paracoccus sp. (in: a-proteobacteria)]
MPDINIQIGAHGLFDSAAKNLLAHKNFIPGISDVVEISASEYRKHWRAATLSGVEHEIEIARNGDLAARGLGDGARKLHFLCNPNIIGNDNAIFKGGVLYKGAEDRLFNLLSILCDYDPLIKVMICNIDIFAGINNSTAAAISPLLANPWADFIERISNICSGRPLNVYAVSDVTVFCNHLPEILFDTPIDRSRLVKRLLSEEALNFGNGIDARFAEESHGAYLEDLTKISKISNVELCIL